ncbi:MAG: HDOD domain-containing protein [Proteobacteria bacterium]|nr:HDOD domain-containing protein [Pseudomonadota bacterium]
MQTNQTQIESQVAENILKSIRIPPCPEVVVALMKETAQEDVDFTKLVKLISGDVGLAASMLKTANSPFFALRNKAGSVQQAVSVLGLKNLMQIVRGSALQNALGGEKVHMERFWDRSTFTAVVASHMSAHVEGVSREEAYTYGLFHDCGIPILMSKFPDYKETLAASNKSAELIIVIEDQHYATNHAIVGNMLARNWCLPDYISQAILAHHDHTIFTQRSTTPLVCALVAIQLVSEHIVATFLQKPDDAEWHLSGQEALHYLCLSDDDLLDITEDALTELEEIRAYR